MILLRTTVIRIAITTMTMVSESVNNPTHFFFLGRSILKGLSSTNTYKGTEICTIKRIGHTEEIVWGIR